LILDIVSVMVFDCDDCFAFVLLVIDAQF
jgi:hypothetical protein